MENPDKKDVAALWSALSALRGSLIPELFLNQIFALLFHEYISDGCQERFILPQGEGFYDVFEKRHEPGNRERIEGALQRIEEANSEMLKGIFEETRFGAGTGWYGKEANERLRLMLEIVARCERDPCIMAESFLHECSFETGRITQSFYTLPAVSQLLARLVDPEPGDAIADPICGSASLLLYCAERVREKTGGARDYTLSGQERFRYILSLARMNMYLHSENARTLEFAGTLHTPLLDENGGLQRFDVIVAHLPFSPVRWDSSIAANDIYKRFTRGIPPRNRTEYAFILHMVEMMRPGSGRLAVLVPHGVLFRGGTEGTIRSRLIEENLLDAVIGLPGKLLYDTVLPAAILVFRKQKRDDSVLFIDASQEYLHGKNQNILSREGIEKISKAYAARKNVKDFARLATRKEIQANKYNLSIPKYVDKSGTVEAPALRTLFREKAKLADELDALDRELNAYLTDLGFTISERLDNAHTQNRPAARPPENSKGAESGTTA